jgi:hypothetical protein
MKERIRSVGGLPLLCVPVLLLLTWGSAQPLSHFPNGETDDVECHGCFDFEGYHWFVHGNDPQCSAPRCPEYCSVCGGVSGYECNFGHEEAEWGPCPPTCDCYIIEMEEEEQLTLVEIAELRSFVEQGRLEQIQRMVHDYPRQVHVSSERHVLQVLGCGVDEVVAQFPVSDSILTEILE